MQVSNSCLRARKRPPGCPHCLLWSNFKTDMSSCLHHSSLQHTASVSSSMLLMEKCTPALKQDIRCSCPSQPLPPCHSVKGTGQPQRHKYIYFLLTVVLFIHRELFWCKLPNFDNIGHRDFCRLSNIMK